MENFPFLNEALIRVVKRLRSDAGYSQQKLAEKSAIDRLYILQLEQGKFRPTLNSVFFLARGLGIAPDELVRLIEQERQRTEQSQQGDIV